MPIWDSYGPSREIRLEERLNHIKDGQICLQRVPQILQNAFGDIIAGNRRTPSVTAALDFVTLPPVILALRPDIFVRKQELNKIIGPDSKLGTVVETDTARFIGCGPLEIEMGMLTSPNITPGKEFPFAGILSAINQDFDTFVKMILRGDPDDSLSNLIAGCIELTPTVNSRSIHFSDPVYDPGVTGIASTQKEREKQLRLLRNQNGIQNDGEFSIETLKSMLRENIWNNIPPAYRGSSLQIFWEQLAPNFPAEFSGTVFTKDSAQSLATIPQQVGFIGMNHLDPRILNETGLSVFDKHESFREWMHQFNNIILKQLQAGGELLLSVGEGNTREELRERLMVIRGLSRLFESQQLPFDFFSNCKPEPEIPILQGTKFPDLRQEAYYIQTASHGLLRVRFVSPQGDKLEPQEVFDKALSETDHRRLHTKLAPTIAKRVNSVWPTSKRK